MSMLRPIAWLAAVLSALPTAALAINHQPPDQQLTPFVDPSYFSHDFQFFAPAEVDDFGGEERSANLLARQMSLRQVSQAVKYYFAVC